MITCPTTGCHIMPPDGFVYCSKHAGSERRAYDLMADRDRYREAYERVANALDYEIEDDGVGRLTLWDSARPGHVVGRLAAARDEARLLTKNQTRQNEGT